MSPLCPVLIVQSSAELEVAVLSRFTDQADLERKGSIDVFSLRITWRYSLEIQHASTKDEYDIGGRTSGYELGRDSHPY